MTPGSLGPWFCALFFNTSAESKKKTHLVAHTLPHVACDALNRSGVTSGDRWIMILKVGPFAEWNAALAFLEQWMSRKRGKQRRLERGIELYAAYRERYGLVLWGQRQDVAEQGVEPMDMEDEGDEDEEEQQAASSGPPASAVADVACRQPFAELRRSFAVESALTIRGLVTICGGMGLAAK